MAPSARAIEPAPSLYVPLPKPPSAFSLTVRKLLGRVLEGAIRVPEFQRPLRWTTSDVVTLFDSILKGYPVGSLLFWKRELAEAEIRVGAAKIQMPAVRDGWLIVDGQQRATALAAALSDLPQGGDSRWDIRFDPKSNQFLPGCADEGDPHRHVPLRALGDLRRLGHWLRDCGLDEEEQNRVEAVQQRILDYELPAYLLETDDVDALRGVFARLNSTGVRMRADEVFQALLGGVGSRGAPVDLGALQAAVDLDGFGQPPRTEVLKCVFSMSGLDASKRLDDLGDDTLGKLVGGDDAAEAIRRAVEFLRAPHRGPEPGAALPAYALIPYPVVFVLLARWFHLFPEPDAATRRALASWVWRGIASGVHQQAAGSAMRLQARQIKEGEPLGSLRALLEAVGEPSSREWALEPFHANHAGSRVELLALLSLAPRSPLGEVSWRALLSGGQRVAREIFAAGQVEVSLARTAANRVLLDTRHTGLASELRSWSWDRDHEALESHLIDEEGFASLQASRVDRSERERFLQRRASRLSALVSRFLSDRAGLDEPRILPVEAYFDARPNGELGG